MATACSVKKSTMRTFQSIDETLFREITETQNAALTRVLRHLKRESYKLYGYADSVEVAYFPAEQMAYIVDGSELELLEHASSAKDALNQWLQDVDITPTEAGIISDAPR